MENQVNQVIDKLAEKFGIVVDWSSQNVTPYIQDLMNRLAKYEISTSIGWITLWGMLMIVCLIAFYKTCKEMKICIEKKDNEKYGACFAVNVFLFICISAFVFIIMVQVNDIFNALYIPERLFLSEIKSYMQ